jgi:hypothetical protein
MQLSNPHIDLGDRLIVPLEPAQKMLIRAKQQFEANRDRYLAQRQRLRRRQGEYVNLMHAKRGVSSQSREGAPAPDDVKPTTAEVADQIEKAEVEIEIANMEVEALKAQVRTLVELLRGFEFSGYAQRLDLVNRQGVPREPTDGETRRYEKALGELRQQSEATQASYREAKLARARVEKQLVKLVAQYQRRRSIEKLEQLVGEGDQLTVLVGKGPPRELTQIGVQNGRLLIYGPLPGLQELKVEGLTGRQLKVAIVNALRERGRSEEELGLVQPDPDHPGKTRQVSPADADGVSIGIESPVELQIRSSKGQNSIQRQGSVDAQLDQAIKLLQSVKGQKN